MPEQETKYPVTLEVDYPDRDLNRVTTAFRCFTVIPPAIILGLLSGSSQAAGCRGST